MILDHLIKKEFIQILRSRPMIAITFGAPIIQLIVLGFAISGDIDNVPAAVTDLDKTALSRSLVHTLDESPYIDIRSRPGDPRAAAPLLEHGDVLLSVTIPRNFRNDLLRGERPAIGVTADAQNSQVALTATGYVRRIVLSWALESLRAETPGKRGPASVDVESRIWYNEELKSVYFMVPGIIVVLVTVITLMLTAMAIVREREIGTLEQLLVTPISRIEMILGKTIPFAVLGMIEVVIALVIARTVYGIFIAGSVPLFLAISLLYILCTLGIGLFISTFTQTQQQALFAAWFAMVYCILMSGFFLPIQNMPDVVRALTYINPLRYFMTVVRELFLKGAGAADLAPQIAALAVIAVFINTLSVIRFNKRLD